jgi:hypothetical protein
MRDTTTTNSVECAKTARSRRRKYTPEEEATQRADWLVSAQQEALRLKAKFDELDAGIRPRGGIVVHTLDEMLPLIDEVQKVLSRKGLEYNPYNELPKWGGYIRELALEFKINFRTIQANLKIYREGKAKRGSSPDTRWNLRTQHQAAKGLEVASKIVEAVKTGKPVKSLVRSWEDVAFTPAAKDTLLSRVDSVTAFTDGVLTPYLASMFRYIRSLEDAVYFHAPDITADRDHRVWQYKQEVYDDVPQELREAVRSARHQPARSGSKESSESPMGNPHGTPLEGRVRISGTAPDLMTV